MPFHAKNCSRELQVLSTSSSCSNHFRPVVLKVLSPDEQHWLEMCRNQEFANLTQMYSMIRSDSGGQSSGMCSAMLSRKSDPSSSVRTMLWADLYSRSRKAAENTSWAVLIFCSYSVAAQIAPPLSRWLFRTNIVLHHRKLYPKCSHCQLSSRLTDNDGINS